jgi:hypothetical protein
MEQDYANLKVGEILGGSVGLVAVGKPFLRE